MPCTNFLHVSKTFSTTIIGQQLLSLVMCDIVKLCSRSRIGKLCVPYESIQRQKKVCSCACFVSTSFLMSLAIDVVSRLLQSWLCTIICTVKKEETCTRSALLVYLRVSIYYKISMDGTPGAKAMLCTCKRHLQNFWRNITFSMPWWCIM